MSIRGTAAVVALLAFASANARAESPEDAAFKSDLAPLLSEFCARCHSGDKAKSGLDLLKYSDAASVQKARKTWDRVREALESGTMPPENKPQPTARKIPAA
jgi:hypothetical protein